MEERLNRLENKIDLIIYLLEKQNHDCNKMSKHIDFIDNVYTRIKYPLFFICSNVSKFMGRSGITQNTGTIHKLDMKQPLIANTLT